MTDPLLEQLCEELSNNFEQRDELLINNLKSTIESKLKDAEKYNCKHEWRKGENRPSDDDERICVKCGRVGSLIWKIEKLESQNKSLSEENAKLKEEREKLRGLPIPKECNELNKLHPYHEFLEQQIKQLQEEQKIFNNLKNLFIDYDGGLVKFIRDMLDQKTPLHEEIQNLKSQLEETKEEQDAFLRFNGCDSFLQLQNKIHDSFSKEEKLQKQLEQANKVIQLIKDFSKFEQLCLDCEYSTVSGVDVEKLQQSILAKYEEKS